MRCTVPTLLRSLPVPRIRRSTSAPLPMLLCDSPPSDESKLSKYLFQRAPAAQLQAPALSVNVSTSLPAPFRAVSTWYSTSAINQTISAAVVKVSYVLPILTRTKNMNIDALFSLQQQTADCYHSGSRSRILFFFKSYQVYQGK